jgi:hypothetical protein
VRLDLRKHSGNVRKDTFVCNLFAVVRGKDDELLIRILDSLTPDAFSGLAPRLGPRAAQLDMGLQNVLINKAIGLLEQLHNEPEEFRERLATLEAISAVLEGKPANRLMNWCKIVGTLEAADREFRSQQGMLKKLSLDERKFRRELGEKLAKLLPYALNTPITPQTYAEDQRPAILAQIIKALGYKHLLAHDFVYGVDKCMENKPWPNSPSEQRAGKRGIGNWLWGNRILLLSLAGTSLLFAGGYFVGPKIVNWFSGPREGVSSQSDEKAEHNVSTKADKAPGLEANAPVENIKETPKDQSEEAKTSDDSDEAKQSK